MSLFVVNLVASSNLEKQYAKKCCQSYDKILQKYLSKSLSLVKLKKPFSKFLFNFTKN